MMKTKTLGTFMKKHYTAEKRAAIRQAAKAKAAAVRLQRLREDRHITQEQLAELLGMTQAALSRLERRPNVTMSALQRYIEALGGRLEIRAVFADETEEILA